METEQLRRVWWCIGILTLACLAMARLDVTRAAAQQPGSVTPDGNQLRNPGFEAGQEPWFAIASWKTSFALSTEVSHSGTHSAVLTLDSGEGGAALGTRVYGMVQDIRPAKFPEKIAGYYYVEHWQHGTPRQYIQCVVAVLGAHNIPAVARQAKNHQIRYVLAGVDQPPMPMANVHYMFLHTHQPALGQWIYFERHLAADFQAVWGEIPQGYEALRIFLEARWDHRQAADGVSSARVFFDDVFVGDLPR